MHNIKTALLYIVFALFLASCTVLPDFSADSNPNRRKAVYKVGEPYEVRGVVYYPARDDSYDEIGIASWYGDEFGGRRTANGEIFRPGDISAAHKTLPLPSAVRVTNLDNGRTMNIRINDRGPFARGRIIDISEKGAELLGFRDEGTARVRVQVLPAESFTLETEAKRGRFPDLNPQGGINVRPRVRGDATPEVSLNTGDGDTARGGGGVSALALISESRGPDVVTVDPVATRLWVQAGSFGNADNAAILARQIGFVTGLEVKVSRFDAGDAGIFHRVRVGPFENVAAADRALEELLYHGYNDAEIKVEQ